MDKRHPENLFTGKAEVYAATRPSYPEQLLQWLESRADFESVADVGAGTGIFTVFLQPVCQKIIAVEPNPDMRQVFARMPGGWDCIQGSAEAIPLPDNSLTLIAAAQAFHWFDEIRFREECRRLLRPEGKLLIVWNNAVDSDSSRTVKEICRKYCPAFKSGHAGKRTAEEGDRFLREEYFRELDFFSCPNPLLRTEEQFIGDQLSRSYALTPASPQYTEYLSELRRTFHQFAENGLLRDDYETTAYLGKI